jgi:hypothetical protein
MVLVQSIFAAMMIVTAGLPVRGEDGTADLPHALRRIEDASVGLKSLRVTTAFRTADAHDPSAPPREVVFDEIWQGERWRLERDVTAPGKSGLERTEAFDGKTYSMLMTSLRQAVTVEKRMFPSDGWSSIYGSSRGVWHILEPVRSQLDAKWISAPGTSGKRLLAVRWNQESASHEMHLDPAVDYQPRWWRVVLTPSSDRIPVRTVTKTVKFEEYVASREFWFVSKGQETHESVMKDGTVIARQVSFGVTRVEANPEIASQEFSIEYPDGTKFYDGLGRRFSEMK